MYFTPRRYPFERYASTPPDGPFEPVVVVGAGPVGLTLALGLVQRGVAVTLLEAGDSVSYGSRAICLSRNSLEVFDRLGTGEPFHKTALPWIGGRSFYRDTEVLRFEMPHAPHDVRPPMVNISQSVVEQFLVDAAANRDGCHIRWQSTVVGCRQEVDHVVLEVDTPEGPQEVRAGWVVAADGARSRMRELLDLRLSGTSYEGRYVIADIHWPSPLPTERLVWFDPPSNPGSTIIMHRQPDDIWRVDYQLAPGEDPEVEVQEPRIRERITRHLDWLATDVPWSLEWASIYRAHSLSLGNYVHGRVVFAGDAAHLVPIFGVRGLNSGIEDADTLAWQLALVVTGQAKPELLDAYGRERRDAWRQNVEAAEKSTLFMTPGTHGYATTRDAVLALALRREIFRHLVNPRQSSPTHARMSPITWSSFGTAAGVQPGDPISDRRIGVVTPDGTMDSTLQRERGTGFGVLGVGVDQNELRAAVQSLAARLQPTETVRGLLLGEPGKSPAGSSAPDVAVLDDTDGAFLAALDASPGEVFVIRPDGLLLARFEEHGLNQGDAIADHLLDGMAPGVVPVTAAEPETTDRAVGHVEAVWRTVSHALDEAAEDDREGFLTRLVLLLATDHTDAATLRAATAEAASAPHR